MRNKLYIRPTNSFFCLKHTVPVITDAQALQTYFYTTWVRELIAKTTLESKLAGGWARGASQKFRDPLLISVTVEGSNFKFGTQCGFGEYVAMTVLVPNLVVLAGLQEHLKNCVDYVPCTT